MAIIIDEAIWTFRGNLYCHMISDVPGQPGLDELHEFAARIGLKRSWFQDKPRWPHYDVIDKKRKQAIALGAEEVTGMELVQRNPNRGVPSCYIKAEFLGDTYEDQNKTIET